MKFLNTQLYVTAYSVDITIIFIKVALELCILYNLCSQKLVSMNINETAYDEINKQRISNIDSIYF